MPEVSRAIRLRSPCCDAAFRARHVMASNRLIIQRCPSCGIMWGQHLQSATGKPWDDAYLSQAFVSALRQRRERQASTLLSILQRQNFPSPVLDYGSGQGVLLTKLLASGFDAWGCDIDPEIPQRSITSGRTITLERPWELPPGDWRTVVMLDVLEHNEDPVSFLSKLPASALLIKVPVTTGPAAVVARVMARLGRPGQLEQLYLVGENAPHYWLATRRGLKALAQRAGWHPESRRALAEVGTELPDRIRPRPATRVARTAAAAAGALTAIVGRFWSDTEVQYFSRTSA